MNEHPIILELESRHHAEQREDGAVLCQEEPAKDWEIENALVFNVGGEVALTKRENEILRLIVGGRTNKQIARHLSRSERTVEYHRNRLMRKMAAHNAAELVRRALELSVV
jgi:DNA-binding NarL/FixJ family response regulator